MEFRFHRLAAKDYLVQCDGNARRSPKVAERFVGAVDAAVQKILANPYACSKHDDDFRWTLVRKFPYILYFQIVDEDNIRVLAGRTRQPKAGILEKAVPVAMIVGSLNE